MIESHFEYAEEHLDEYLDWSLNEVLPKYENFLKGSKVDRKDERAGVAGVFMEICGQFGFFEIGNLHPGFIKDFPDMFMESVKGHKLSRKEIAQYLGEFIDFISIYYPNVY